MSVAYDENITITMFIRHPVSPLGGKIEQKFKKGYVMNSFEDSSDEVWHLQMGTPYIKRQCNFLNIYVSSRYVLVPEKNTLHSPNPRFLPLDSPFARAPNPTHPPLFAAILRRTTGIKVLECHAFICKRKLQPMRLYDAVFHAYADSSYAKQVDTAGSIYGTLASERLSNKDRIEEWKMSRSQSGSTMTLNTITKDDISIYNGDENHKVWAGSQDNLDGIYDVYSSSTISRPSRPRQIAQPVAVPPPPAKEKKKKMKGKSLAGSREDLYHPIMNGKASSVSGSMLKSRQQAMHQMGPPGPQPIYIMAPPPGTLPNPKFFKHHGNTFSHRPRGRVLIPARPIPPPMVPVAPVIIPTMQKNKKKQKHVEEPIYMPSNRALSPVASYQPVSFPHEAYLMQHYATMESQGKQRKSREKSIEKAKLNKKLAQSMNGLDDPNLVSDESPFNTGIYRKKRTFE
ncbi:hypothetical protein NQ317_017771 [Molorchus minor]|uniref:PID domain-containing protein n=1 Tax=Molorchus minor TaxID=1323400 RepID=A0ABQ9JJQ4_9CUCU|nr:hypothetical protein NQ317_017771 [Molorchus minor]